MPVLVVFRLKFYFIVKRLEERGFTADEKVYALYSLLSFIIPAFLLSLI